MSVDGHNAQVDGGVEVLLRHFQCDHRVDRFPAVGAELERLNKVLEVAKRNGNQIFIQNIEREIAAIKRGENSPLIADYLTDEERSGSRPGREA